jgi:hypothetical protein
MFWQVYTHLYTFEDGDEKKEFFTPALTITKIKANVP